MLISAIWKQCLKHFDILWSYSAVGVGNVTLILIKWLCSSETFIIVQAFVQLMHLNSHNSLHLQLQRIFETQYFSLYCTTGSVLNWEKLTCIAERKSYCIKIIKFECICIVGVHVLLSSPCSYCSSIVCSVVKILLYQCSHRAVHSDCYCWATDSFDFKR